MTDPTAAAGWYAQPDGSQRYWDGQAWTEQVQPAVSAHAQSRTYDGIGWLGVRWGRSGRPAPARVAAAAFAIAAAIQFVIAAQGSSVSTLIAVSGAASALGALAFWVDAHFAARVEREQA
ncbi:MAG: DUF2510 domain-containing protein [Demequina sp.]